MFSIINVKTMQQKVGEISRSIGEKSFVVTKNGIGHIVMLPYFDGCDEAIGDYMEDYEVYRNRDKLQKKWKKSFDSGSSDLTV